MPCDSGYPAYLNQRLSSFYNRAGKVKCLGSPNREGSITIIASISPPAGDFTSDPVSSFVLSTVESFWALDKRLAERKQFPSINWIMSFSNNKNSLDSYYHKNIDESYSKIIKITKKILQSYNELEELIISIGRDHLSDSQTLILDIGDIIIEDFLAQNQFTHYDYTCPLTKTIGMLKCTKIYEQFEMLNSPLHNSNLKWYNVKESIKPILQKVSEGKFLDPHLQFDQIKSHFDLLTKEIEDRFYDLRLSILS
eukprot:gene8252-11167_t